MLNINIQNACSDPNIPNEEQLQQWALLALGKRVAAGALTLRIVDAAESQGLNHHYRQQDKPTNVLAFPFEAFPGLEPREPIIGDVVICTAIVNQEATQQHKTANAHWAHIVIHGVLHLLGYDHIEASQAKVMESLEIDLLQQLGYADPYE